jgi:hypothetical protein
MTALIEDGDDPPTRDEVRQLESRLDTRFEAINVRFSTTDRQHVHLRNRVEDIERAPNRDHLRRLLVLALAANAALLIAVITLGVCLWLAV